MSSSPNRGPVGWIDLTVPDAEAIRDGGGGRFCVIRDPAGAVAALYAAVPSRAAADL